jgi:hypothetical protein
MKYLKHIPVALAILMIVGCASLYQSVITITSVVDSAMKDWASLSAAGKTSAAIDAKVTIAHNTYRSAAGTAQAALVAYKSSGDQTQYVAALNAAKVAAQGLIDLIVPLLDPSTGNTLSNNLSKAKTL